MISDFFFPSIGGVEAHILHLSHFLLHCGIKVYIVTSACYNKSCKKRLIFDDGCSINVYYLPLRKMYNYNSWPAVSSSFEFFLSIWNYESIDVLHAHQAFSSLFHDAVQLASIIGNIKCVFTDHSLFGFNDVSSFFTNLWLKFTLSHVNSTICVSHCGRENTILRSCPYQINSFYTIPNALINTFKNDINKRKITTTHNNNITIVIVSRLVLRKGIDLLGAILPHICSLDLNCDKRIKILIGGDGPKKILLEQVREKFRLNENICFLGPISNKEVFELLHLGHIFINTSLTEAFCTAILEAASTNLKLICTRVGGVAEVLPKQLITLTDSKADGNNYLNNF